MAPKLALELAKLTDHKMVALKVRLTVLLTVFEWVRLLASVWAPRKEFLCSDKMLVYAME